MIYEEKEQTAPESNQENDESCQQNDNQENTTDRCQAEVSLWKDQCKRISAEFENFKKRSERDQLRWIEIAKEKTLKELLPFVDDFERALRQDASNAGIQLMHQSFMKFLQKNGVTMMQAYDEFNPELHEAVMQIETPDYKPGHIVEVFVNGFMMQDRVLRPAQVSVAK